MRAWGMGGAWGRGWGLIERCVCVWGGGGGQAELSVGQLDPSLLQTQQGMRGGGGGGGGGGFSGAGEVLIQSALVLWRMLSVYASVVHPSNTHSTGLATLLSVCVGVHCLPL